jgi:Nif-specific regulatory protein
MIKGDTIRDFAFPCKQNKCLTQTLHFLDKADAVAAVAPPNARPAPASPAHAPSPPVDAPFGDSEVTLIGPTHASPRKGSGAAPPEGADERQRLIWAMEQCGWVQAKAARLLRLTPRQLGYALQKNRIEVRKF